MKNLQTSAFPSIHFGPLSENGFESVLQKEFSDSRIILLTDETVSAHWSEYLVTQFHSLRNAEIIEIPAGEETKNLGVCQSVWEALSEYEIKRNDVIINLGGGVVTDLGGFIASAYKRGIRFINVPTTLLAQVDAAIGGKTGIDLGPFKNQIGSFAHPEHIFVDAGFLQTLPNEELVAGYAEMLKHGLVADSGHWQELRAIQTLNLDNIRPFISSSATIKLKLVESDFFEKGPRKKLNFGHTIGHAIEGYMLERGTPILHGNAVGLGILAESFISFKMGLLEEVDLNEIAGVCKSHYAHTLTENPSKQSLISLMRNDKKNNLSGINFTLLNGIGAAVYDQSIDEALIKESLSYLYAIG